MAPWYVAFILGIVEGLTEFLPISSTGHLIITGHLLGFTGPKAETFEIVIQLGAIMAVVVLYWQRFIGLIIPDPKRKFSGIYGLWLLFLTSLPASVLGLLTHGYIKQYLFSPTTVAVALAVGAVFIFAVEGVSKDESTASLDDITPKLALGIGLFQCLALWPGFSRSASTIMGGMLLGAKRTVAAEYSFIAAVPIMFAATGYDFLKNYQLFESNDMAFLLIGFLVSFVSAWLAVKGFIYLLGRLTLRPFAIYRLALAPLILLFL
ncbi:MULTISPECIES: undecaprenyl-diphosphate phosphatase [unclassified Pseudodesulfovibrio]|uniref:undecaprenyl-diphosphate phosphatase n=1 Tax=unclassified Pseudodesulfovibrio TaxID=2661612 RepID=UPI000FEBA876|nr:MULTISPECIES: undecaprenyl-diphosphate phosphatase [unclassified Pseudodesulfovibrio]MCJ2163819.1 undecaprenyl-diphosphate phosphatase [Pseudodesulfovibrio sp. S3-i]RWU05934.1 undecaprenyl-diphosphate phosphatase [Pseudodesulfovibrio sp. S3]